MHAMRPSAERAHSLVLGVFVIARHDIAAAKQSHNVKGKAHILRFTVRGSRDELLVCGFSRHKLQSLFPITFTLYESH